MPISSGTQGNKFVVGAGDVPSEGGEGGVHVAVTRDVRQLFAEL